MAIKLAHDVMKPDEELRERSVLATLEADAVAWRKLPRETRGGFSAYEAKRIEAERANCAEACERLSREVEAAYRALDPVGPASRRKCPQGRSALMYLTSDLAASKPCAALLAEHPCEHYEKYLGEIEA